MASFLRAADLRARPAHHEGKLAYFLKMLSLGNSFDHSIDTDTWPESLNVWFGYISLQPSHRSSMVASFPAATGLCKQLRASDGYYCMTKYPSETGARVPHQPASQPSQAPWPQSLQQFTFGRRFNQPIDGVAWPLSLESLMFERDFSQPIAVVQWPPSLQQLKFGTRFNQPSPPFAGLSAGSQLYLAATAPSVFSVES